MIINELMVKFNLKKAIDILNNLYGENQSGVIRNRYKTLISNLFTDDLQQGNLRVFSAPGRTELAGNHTDHNQGKVLAAAVQLDYAAIVQKRNDNVIFFRSTGFTDISVKLTDESSKLDLEPQPEETGKTEALIRGIASEFHRRGYKVGGFTVNSSSAVLPGSGLSSSAAVEVLFGRIISSLYNEDENNKSGLNALEIAQIGQIAENKFFGKPCGLMDQIACSFGGVVAIDFKDTANPLVNQIDFNPSAFGYTLCVVNTGGSHANLTADYASIPTEMKSIASFFGKSVLRELDKNTVIDQSVKLKKEFGERAFQRAIHFFEENARVDAMVETLSGTLKHEAFNQYLDLVNESGNSSQHLLQNIFSPGNPENQSLGTALALTKDFFRDQNIRGACRVHGGGFAGTIQTYIPKDAIGAYRACMEDSFGAGCVTELRIRSAGAFELDL